ncbi:MULTISPECIES: hypothetical protein [Clostridium]|uniref:hypothetical protein n=1 Tax=Clostridium TaxID=1485 RepID=UPI0008253671|nr:MULTISPECIES: hypothetical protein [Clostridium]PJI06886.1 hypothetical protein CUB90_02950 [Clostridium sp. CT7]
MTWLLVFTTFVMMFLTQVRGISLATAGFVMSSFSGFVGMILISGLSDYFVRRTMLIISFFINGISVLLICFKFYCSCICQHN